MKTNYWKSLENTLNILGFLNLLFMMLIFVQFEKILNSPFAIIGAAVSWLLFVTGIFLFIIAANLKHIPYTNNTKSTD